MALFEKKSQLEKLLAGFNSLSDEEKAKFKEEIGGAETSEPMEEKPMEEPKEEVEEADAEPESEPMENSEASEPESEDNTSEPEEEAEMEKADEEKEEELMAGIEARLKALEEKFTQLMSNEDKEDKDFGASGYGKTQSENTDTDTRSEDIIKKLGGRA